MGRSGLLRRSSSIPLSWLLIVNVYSNKKPRRAELLVFLTKHAHGASACSEEAAVNSENGTTVAGRNGLASDVSYVPEKERSKIILNFTYL
jgi:hypothetical protein